MPNDNLLKLFKILFNSTADFCFCLIIILVLIKILNIRNPYLKYNILLIPLIKLWYDFFSNLMTSGLNYLQIIPVNNNVMDFCFSIGLGSSGVSLWSLIFTFMIAKNIYSIGDIALSLLGTNFANTFMIVYLSISFALIILRYIFYYSNKAKILRSSFVNAGLSSILTTILHDKNEAKLLTNVEIFTSTEVHSPMVINVINPKIIIPLNMRNELSDEELILIIRHELTHIRRFDNLINHIFAISKDLFFLIIPVASLIRTINVEREKICDRMAIEHKIEKAILFSKTMLKVAQLSISNRLMKPAYEGFNLNNMLFCIQKTDFLTRVTEILSLKNEKKRAFDNIFAYLLFSAMILKILIGISFFTSSGCVATCTSIAMKIVLSA